MTHPATVPSPQPWNTPETALETSRQFRDAFGGRSRQWEFRKSESDPNFPKPIFVGPRKFYRVADRLEYVRILKERSDAKLAARAAAKAARELAAEADSD